MVLLDFSLCENEQNHQENVISLQKHANSDVNYAAENNLTKKNNTLTLQDQNLKKIKKHSHENVGLNELKMRQKFCVTFKKLEGGFHCQLACRFILSIVDEYILHTLNNAHNLTKKKNRKEENPQNLYNREVTAGRKLQRPTQTISRGMFLESFTTLTCFLQLPKHIPCTHVQPVIFHANRTL